MNAPVFPPREEWDFSAIDDVVLKPAIIYEYARTSSLIRSSLCACLDSKIKGRTIRDHLLDSVKAGHSPDDKISDKVDEAVGGVKNDVLLLIVSTMKPDFPKPWSSFSVKYRRDPAFSRVREKTLFSPMVGGTRHIFDIYWSEASIDEIVSDFEKWLRKEAKVHHEMKPRGRPGQLQQEPLKWLVAYRLQKAGFTFERAQEALRSRTGCWSLPRYADKSGWSHAITHAKSYLADLEAPLKSKLEAPLK